MSQQIEHLWAPAIRQLEAALQVGGLDLLERYRFKLTIHLAPTHDSGVCLAVVVAAIVESL